MAVTAAPSIKSRRRRPTTGRGEFGDATFDVAMCCRASHRLLALEPCANKPGGKLATRSEYGRGTNRRTAWPYAVVDVEPMTGIEPAYSAWEVDLARRGPLSAVHGVG